MHSEGIHKHVAKNLHQWPTMVEIQVSLGDHPNQSSSDPKAKHPEGEGSFECGLGPSDILFKPPLKTVLVHYILLILSY